ncbi:MFS transporter [Nocardiopsis terrae]|uniref:DHA2 family multidrug resistance protein-like MFS transporter n=1 Tax=Nocardiopsis terrae TaxID=372655 RepID=A0ABR9HDT9_9ACTN|nr:MFS transporter [Nocardiopsis terrae]MBE1457198.1 DHA2 family multidrug resistance protein-like MFS transporter [Nocardiopsis terrae]GHC91102.1 MFS transporter [Nocardiopsis terrae]
MSSAEAGNGTTRAHGDHGGPPALAGPREWAALAVLVLPVVLISVDMTVLGFAVPALSEALKPTSGQLLWIIDIYGFVLAGLLITMGSLGDRIGRRRLLMAGSAAFGTASLLAAFSPNAETLILARALLGVAGASLMPSTLSLLRNIFLNPRQRLLAIAIWASGFSGGAALGPILGGWLLEHFFWGSVFLINLPVMALILVLVPLLVRESRNPDSSRIDLLSVVLSLGAMLPAVYGIKKLATEGPELLPVLSLVFGLAVGYLFVRRQRGLRDPLIDVDLFRSRVFSVAVVTNLMIVFSMVGSLFFLTQYLQLVLGVSPMRAGVVLLPGLVLSVVASLIAARVARHLSLATVIGASLLVTAAGFATLVLTPADDVSRGIGLVVTAFLLIALGSGFAETLTNGAIMSAAPPKRAGAASAISETAYELGGALGVAVLGSVLTAFYRNHLTEVDGVPADATDAARETLGGAANTATDLGGTSGAALMDSARLAFTEGMHLTSVIAVVIVLAAAFQAWFLLRGRGNPAVEAQESEVVQHGRSEAARAGHASADGGDGTRETPAGTGSAESAR